MCIEHYFNSVGNLIIIYIYIYIYIYNWPDTSNTQKITHEYKKLEVKISSVSERIPDYYLLFPLSWRLPLLSTFLFRLLASILSDIRCESPPG